ncbi:hypothetical protein MLD38_003537 [Melastoma candidum]|uniref:Uncharacterized protein n=1 Tax=Melastoma candidum TaxID=119954 RepID=A0ACB9S626_9MYRT|nr:hypothetical protein MLD38_003537 [Melastoma candidum]
MEWKVSSALLFLSLQFLFLFIFAVNTSSAAPEGQTTTSNLFREYIGAEGKGIKFDDVPINPNVEFHFILSFAIDYTNSTEPHPTDGIFTAYWDTQNLSTSAVSAIKARYPNVRVALSLGGDSFMDQNVTFAPKSNDSWVENAVTSLTKIIQEYKLEGIDIDYEHFGTDPNTFAECIGQLLHRLKQNNTISFASIAPYDDDGVPPYYLALWQKYGDLIDYVNFQFYAYSNETTVPQFIKYFYKQSTNYKGGKVLASMGTDVESNGLSPKHGFFKACKQLKKSGNLHGIFMWSADDSKKAGFPYEKEAQILLATK